MVYTNPKKNIISNILSITKTAADDNKFRLVQAETWIREGNFIISTNNAKYGDQSEQNGTLTAGSILSFQDFNLADIFFINAGAGSNTVVNFVGVLMSDGHKKILVVGQGS
jgi:hypothetical protein